MESKKVIIIGGGISGLVSGIHCLKNGFKVAIYEKNSNVGGLALSLNIKKNDLNNYLYFPVGINEGEVNNFWKDLNITFESIENDYFAKYKDIYIYKNLEELKKELANISKEDIKKIEELIKNIEYSKKCLVNVDRPIDCMNVIEQTKLGFKHAKTIKMINKYSSMSIEDYFNAFINKDIKDDFCSILPSFYPAYILFMILASYTNGGLTKIKEDSSIIINNLMDYYILLGGEIFYNKKALTIDSYRGKAQGVWFENKVYVNCNYVICAVDAHYVFEQLLQKRNNDRKYLLRYEDYKNYPLISCLSLNYLVKGNINDLPDLFILDIPKIKIGNSVIDKIKVYKNKNNYLTCNVMQSNEDYRYLKILGQNKSLYQKEIDRIENEISKQINDYIGKECKITSSFNIDPLLFENDYNAYMGSILSFSITKLGKMFNTNGRINNINNIYLASQWSSVPGGMLLAAINGKFAVQRLIYDNKRKEEKK